MTVTAQSGGASMIPTIFGRGLEDWKALGAKYGGGKHERRALPAVQCLRPG